MSGAKGLCWLCQPVQAVCCAAFMHTSQLGALPSCPALELTAAFMHPGAPASSAHHRGYQGDGKSCAPNAQALKELQQLYWSEEGMQASWGLNAAVKHGRMGSGAATRRAVLQMTAPLPSSGSAGLAVHACDAGFDVAWPATAPGEARQLELPL